MNIHHHYTQLDEDEKLFVDDVFAPTLWAKAKSRAVPLANDDRIERAVDALARAVIESRPKHNDEIHLVLKQAGLA